MLIRAWRPIEVLAVPVLFLIHAYRTGAGRI